MQRRNSLADQAVLMTGVSGVSFPLFVPADRAERFAKAAASGADGVIVDLEDAVAPADKIAAREGLERAFAQLGKVEVAVLLRINPVGSPWHQDDLAALERLPVAGVVLPKAEHVEDVERVARVAGGRERVLSMIESATGLANARALAAASAQIAFGSYDFAADLGTAHTREALLLARLELVLAARLAGLPGPIDGVTTAIDAPETAQADAAYAASLGFRGKLLIHPRQVEPVRKGFRPSDEELAWAKRILEAAASGSAVAVDGNMVDATVLIRARQILQRAA